MGGGVTGAVGAPASDEDVIGVWFDSAAQLDTLSTTAAGEEVTAYLVIRNPTADYAISGWECIVEVAGDGIVAQEWTLSEGLNIDEAPRFHVGIERYHELPVGPAVVLATVRLLVAGPQSHGWIYVHPYDPASLQDPPGSGNPVPACVYAPAADPSDLRTLAWSSGEEALPVAVINPGAPGPVCHPSSGRLRYGYVPVGGAREKALVLANVGGAPADVEVTAPSLPDFQVVSGGGAFTLAPGGRQEVLVRYEPTAAGSAAAVLTACDEVELTGAGYVPGSCAVAPTSLDLGEVRLGEEACATFGISNPTELDVQGEVASPAGPFRLASGGGAFFLQPGQSREVTVCFTPAALGLATGSLAVLGCGLQVALQATGVEGPPICAVTPSQLDFGSRAAGEVVELAFVVRNRGGGQLSGTVGEAADPFAVVAGAGPFQLASQESLQVTVRYSPTAPGQHTAQVALGSADCGQVTCVGGVPACAVSVAALDFGEVGLGDDALRSLTIQNTGGGVLGGAVTLSDPAFSLPAAPGGQLPYQLAAGQQLTVQVRFMPTALGPQAASLQAGESCGAVALQGTGIESAPICQLSTTLIHFGLVPVGTSLSRTFKIRNVGTGLLTGEVTEGCEEFMVLQGGGPFSVGAGDSCLVRVYYTPSGAGTDTCVVATGTPLCGTVTCTGTGDASTCQLQPASLDFGAVTIGMSSDRSFLIKNIGAGPMTGNVTLISPYFSLVSGGGAFTLAVGGQRTVTVRFKPTGPGVSSGSVATGSTCGDVPCQGEGVAAQCRVDPAVVDFGSVPVYGSADRTFTVTNDGAAAFPIAPGESCALYSIVAGGASGSLAPGESRAVTVRFAPVAAGDAYCMFQLGTPCGSVLCRGKGATADCEISPGKLDFGTLPTGQAADMAFTMTNAGPIRATGTVTLTGSADFSLLQGGGAFALDEGQTREIVVRFQPTGDGLRTATVATGLHCGSVACDGVAQTTPPVCAVAPAQLDFGWLAPGLSQDLDVTISNAGGGALAGSARLTAGSAFSVVAGAGPYLLGPGQSRTVTVRFLAAEAGGHADTLTTGSGCEGVPCRAMVMSGDLDQIGIFFDRVGAANRLLTTEANQLVTAYLLVVGPSQRTGISGWECCVEIEGGALNPVWTCEGNGLNVAAPPCFQVGIPGYPLLWRSVVLLATVRFYQVSPQERTRFFIHPYTYPSLPGTPVYAAGADAGLLVPLAWFSGGEAVPVAQVGPDPVGVGTPPPIVAATTRGVTVSWQCGLPGVDGFHVYRRVSDGKPERRTGLPLAAGPGPMEFLDDVQGLPPGAALRYCYAALRGGEEIARSEEVTLRLPDGTPSRTVLLPAYPNPFNPETTLAFDLAQPGPARLEVFDLAGRRVRRLCDEPLGAGAHQRRWDGRDEAGRAMPSGTYYARLAAEGSVQMQKLSLVR